jgi:hypothetical protein
MNMGTTAFQGVLQAQAGQSQVDSPEVLMKKTLHDTAGFPKFGGDKDVAILTQRLKITGELVR